MPGRIVRIYTVYNGQALGALNLIAKNVSILALRRLTVLWRIGAVLETQ